ncbi:hypothetical protein AgCh_001955 [Apium graveolens]
MQLGLKPSERLKAHHQRLKRDLHRNTGQGVLGSLIELVSPIAGLGAIRAFIKVQKANKRIDVVKDREDNLKDEWDEAREGLKTVESGLKKQLKEENDWTDGLEKEVEKLKAELAAKENLDKDAIIAEYKTSSEYDMVVAHVGVPDVRRAWIVAKRHVKTVPGATWQSFIQEFLAAKTAIEEGRGIQSLSTVRIPVSSRSFPSMQSCLGNARVINYFSVICLFWIIFDL